MAPINYQKVTHLDIIPSAFTSNIRKIIPAALLLNPDSTRGSEIREDRRTDANCSITEDLLLGTFSALTSSSILPPNHELTSKVDDILLRNEELVRRI